MSTATQSSPRSLADTWPIASDSAEKRLSPNRSHSAASKPSSLKKAEGGCQLAGGGGATTVRTLVTGWLVAGCPFLFAVLRPTCSNGDPTCASAHSSKPPMRSLMESVSANDSSSAWLSPPPCPRGRLLYMAPRES